MIDHHHYLNAKYADHYNKYLQVMLDDYTVAYHENPER